jgi:hypothetical protein
MFAKYVNEQRRCKQNANKAYDCACTHARSHTYTYQHIPSALFQECSLSSNFLLIKVKVKVMFTLEQAMKAQRGSRGIAQLFLYPQR